MKRFTFFITACMLLLFAACGEDAVLEPTPVQFEEPPAPKDLAGAIETLSYCYDDRDPERRIAAALLGIAAHKNAVDAVNRHMTSDRDPQVRSLCAWAAGRIGDFRSLPILIQATEDKNPLVRREAILALGVYDDPDARSRLTKIEQEKGGMDGVLAYRALGSAPDSDLESLPKPAVRSAEEKTEPVEGKAWYVDASEGSDQNDGSKEKPFRTLNQGVSMLRQKQGDTLYATSGKNKVPFRELVLVGQEHAGAAGAPTVLRNWPGKPSPMVYASEPVELEAEQGKRLSAPLDQSVVKMFAVGKNKITVLNVSPTLGNLKAETFFYDKENKKVIVMPPEGGLGDAVVEAVIRLDAIRVDRADYVDIIGFNVAFSQDTGINFAISEHGSVVGSTVHHCERHGVFFLYSAYGTVTGCEVYGCIYQGISIRSSPHSVVNNSYSHDNEHDGILFLWDSDNGVVSSSMVLRNALGIKFATGSSLGRVFDSAVKDNKVNQIKFDQDSQGAYLPANE